jgi:hypothetical protein
MTSRLLENGALLERELRPACLYKHSGGQKFPRLPQALIIHEKQTLDGR